MQVTDTQKFNRWTIVESYKGNKSLCRCECGTEKIVQTDNVKKGRSKSCGCLLVDFCKKKKHDLTGKNYNRLTVIREVGRDNTGNVTWECSCSCGNITVVAAPKLKNGTTKSCGCFTKERIVKAGITWAKSDKGRQLRSERNRGKIGPQAYHWKGGKEAENIRLRYSVESRQWRQKVYERDGFVCTECKIKGKRLNAHHIKPWQHFPELRFDLDNGKTLCVDCHRIEHKKIGNPKRKKV